MLLCLRYPFYASEILGIRIEPLMWLRYTLWIPLYPLGVLFEGNLTPDHLFIKQYFCGLVLLFKHYTAPYPFLCPKHLSSALIIFVTILQLLSYGRQFLYWMNLRDFLSNYQMHWTSVLALHGTSEYILSFLLLVSMPRSNFNDNVQKNLILMRNLNWYIRIDSIVITFRD